MSWDRYWKTAIDEIDRTEARVDRTWTAVLAAIVAWELWLRRRTVRRAFALPIVDGGWIDTSNRRALRAFRVAVRADAATMRDALRRELGGTGPLLPSPTAPRRPDATGIAPAAYERTAQAFTANWDQLEAIWREFDRERRRQLPEVAPPGTPAPPEITPDRLEEIELALAEQARQPRTYSGREIEDLYEVQADALINIGRNLGYDLERVTETAVRLSGRFGRREGIADWMDGTPGGTRLRSASGQPWQLNRNNLRLSTAAHVRAVHRRRAISEATAAGITHFRLDVPTSRKDQLGGILADQVWRVRTLADWQDVADRLNRGRVSAAGFDTLGFHHGDFSYVVPVPPTMLGSAIRQGDKFRGRLSAAKEGART